MTLTNFAHLVSGTDSNNESKAIISLHDVVNSYENMRSKITTTEPIMRFWGFENDKYRSVSSLHFEDFDHPDFIALKIMINAYLADNLNGIRELKLYVIDKETTEHAIIAKVINAIIVRDAPMITLELNKRDIKYKHMV